MNGPGYLAVAVQPGWNTDEKIFHHWYNTEHGPLRRRLPFVLTGDRYRAADGQTPEWSAVYDISDLSWLDHRIYTRLREERSLREKAIMSTFESLDRMVYRLVSVRGEYTGPPPVALAVSLRVNESDAEELNKWYDEEYTELVSGLPGWIRTRRFQLLAAGIPNMPPGGQAEYLVVHDFQSQPGLKESGLAATLETRWSNEMMRKIVWQQSRVWMHYLTFSALEEPPSSVVTTDAAELLFQLEGNPTDPLIVFVNSIMTDFHIWDDVAAALIRGVAGKTYRVLRYNARGYSQQDEKSNHTSFDILADDLEYLLQRLKVQKAYTVIGVSMGGVTAINFSIRHPTMLEKFIACDCNIASSVANSDAWAERIELVRSKGMSELARVTVERWFRPENHESEKAKQVLRMAASANIRGFEQNTNALSDYDLKPHVAKIQTPGLLLAGESDGKLPEAMLSFGIASTAFKLIPHAGHLPMLENHSAFMEALAEFL